MPHQSLNVPSQGDKDLNQIIGKVLKIIAIIILIFGALILFRGCVESKKKAKSENVAVKLAEQRGEGVITIENAPTSSIVGKLYRLHNGGWDGPSTTKRVISLNPNDFDVVFANAYGHDWSFRWQNKKGHWTGDSGTNAIMHLQQDGNRGRWSGIMVDTDKSNTPIPFRIEFEVVR